MRSCGNIVKRILRPSLLIVAAGCLILSGCKPGIKYRKLHSVIRDTALVDIHAHPDFGHRDYPEGDPYPTLEPPISRPYWVPDGERIAVFDTLLVPALKAVYGYSPSQVRAENLSELRELSIAFWGEDPGVGFNRLLDICGIDMVFDNTSRLNENADGRRVKWVPFVDRFFYPFEAGFLAQTQPELARTMAYYNRLSREDMEDSGVRLLSFSGYLNHVYQRLREYKSGGAVAVKVASAYFRTLWFDNVAEEEASALFAEGLNGTLSCWEGYKKVQDAIARRVFLKAGELGLPVHFHTGFGADAGLKNLDSNPLNLESVFSDLRFKETVCVLLHTGYPFGHKIKPMLEKRNIYVDFSAVNWMVYAGELAGILKDWLSYPGASEKILFGSDAGAPVFFWIAAENSRRALYAALGELIDDGILDEGKSCRIAVKIMRGNALRIHGLD
jgi:predicted TIM-barrel fold metal-dependent hydrolase